jgi:uncharacterized repeat protein (TIGR01451 family)
LDQGVGSLRQAILSANATAEADVIAFSIDGGETESRTIVLASPLPAISQPLLIDGYTQPGSSPNTLNTGSNARVLITLDGRLLSGDEAGLRVRANNVLLRGLAIGGFATAAGVSFESGSGGAIEGCYVGLDGLGLSSHPNLEGVLVAAVGTRVGGPAVDARNLISANLQSGIRVVQTGSSSVVAGNLIGVAQNLAALGNLGSGVVLDGASSVAVGGVAAANGNIIAHNGGVGVSVRGGGVGNAVLSNAIFLNAGLGIDLGDDGVTANDSLDADEGPNGLINYPFLTGITYNGESTTVEGFYSGARNLPVRIQLFSTGAQIDPSGYGSGAEFLAQSLVTTDAFGVANFSITIAGIIPDGQAFTSTATSMVDGTSEFSAVIAPKADLGVVLSADAEAVFVGSSLTYTIEVTNHGPAPIGRVEVRDVLPANVSLLEVNAGELAWTLENGTVSAVIENLASGQSVTFSLIVSPLAVAAGSIQNRVSVLGSRPDPVAANNLATLTTQVVHVADLSLAVSPATPNPAMSDRDLVYTITVGNAGPNDAHEVLLTERVPSNVTLVSATTTKGSVEVVGGQINTSIGSLAPGASATLTIVLRPTSLAIGSTLTSQARVTAAEVDLNPANNVGSLSVPVVRAADQAVSIETPALPVLFDQSFTQVIRLRNLGPNATSNSVLSVTLPAGVLLLSSSYSDSSKSVVTVGSSVVVSLGSFENEAEGELRLVLKAQAPGEYVTTARLESALYDPNRGNNEASASTLVVPAANLIVTLASSGQSALIGQNLEFLVRVENTGPSPAGAVSLVLELPGMAIASANAAVGTVTIGAQSASVALGSIPVGMSRSFTVSAAPGSEGVFTATARVESTTADPETSNNQIVRTIEGLPHADIGLTMTALPRADMPEGKVALGQTLTYVLDVWNHGPSNAPGVVVTNELTVLAELVSVSLPTGTFSQLGRVLTFTLGDLAAGASLPLTIIVRTTGLGTAANTASAYSGVVDTVPENGVGIQARVVVVQPSVFDFEVESYTIGEAGGSATIVVTRSQSTIGTAWVGYRTSGVDASPGQDFSPMEGVLEFLPGQTTRSFRVPILDEAIAESNETILLTLFDPSEGAVLGLRRFSVLTIVDDDQAPVPPPPVPDTRPPTVSFVERQGNSRQINRLVVHFSEAIPRSVATERRSYQIVSAGRDRKLGTRDDTLLPFYPPLYDPSSNAVLLRPYFSLSLNSNYMLVVLGTGRYALTDAAGNTLDGNRNGDAGGNFVARIEKAKAQPARAKSQTSATGFVTVPTEINGPKPAMPKRPKRR